MGLKNPWAQVRVGSNPTSPTVTKNKCLSNNKKLKAYIIGLALGDGNLSNPNKRAIRLRITCDKKYPLLIENIKKSIEKLLPDNKVGVVNKKDGSIDVSCYSNYWQDVLGWKWNAGSKYKQKVSIPKWIKNDKEYSKKCLLGLFQTDGSIYKDRNYLMVNFVTIIPTLANDVYELISKLKYKANLQILEKPNIKTKYTIRISKNAVGFIKDIKLWKK